MRFALCIAAFAALIFASCEEEGVTDPTERIGGTWDLIGYTDHGIAGATTGTAVFGGDGTFSIQGSVTYPGEPTDTLDVTGTYAASDFAVTLTTDDGVANWNTVYSGDQVVLRLIGPDPPTTMTLKRPG